MEDQQIIPAQKTPKLIFVLFFLFFLVVVAEAAYYFYFQKFVQKDNIFGRRGKIKVVSDISGVSVKLANKDFLEDFLQKIDFFEENGVRLYTFDSLKTAGSLEVHITDKEQAYGRFINSDTKQAYQSFDHSLDGDKFIVYLHFDSKKLEKTFEDEDFKTLNFNLLHALLLSSSHYTDSIDSKNRIDVKGFVADSLTGFDEPIVTLSKKKLLINLLQTSFSLVKPAYAGCQGTLTCGTNQTNCTCSIAGPNYCTATGDPCGYGNAGTCTCNTVCVGDAGPFQCSERRANPYLCGQVGGCGAGYDCVRSYGCYWSGPLPTATPAPPPGDCWCGDLDLGTCAIRSIATCEANYGGCGCTGGNGNGNGGTCSGINYYVPNCPDPNTQIEVDISRVGASNCNGNWNNVDIRFDGSSDNHWVALCYADETTNCTKGYHAKEVGVATETISSGAPGSHALQFTVNNNSCLCNEELFDTKPLDVAMAGGSCPEPGVVATVGWEQGAEPYYSLRVDRSPDSWTGCDTPSPGDFCIDIQADGIYCDGMIGGFCNYSFPTNPGDTYSWWVHARTDVDNCWGSVTVRDFTCVIPPIDPWWQVINGDIATNGGLVSLISQDCVESAICQGFLDLAGPGGFPGIPSYLGTAGFDAGAVSGPDWEWIAESRTKVNKVYDYTYFESMIPSDIPVGELSGVVNNGTFASGQAGPRGYHWYRWDGDANEGQGDLNLNDAISIGTIAGGKGNKVILLVKNANLNIKATINIQIDRRGESFFMVIVEGDINIDPTEVADFNIPPDGLPELEGLFLAQGSINTGSLGEPNVDGQLHVRGSMATTNGAINLERNLIDGNAENPAELFEYAPDLLLTFPRELTSKRLRWKEVAP